ncbi:MAG: CoA-binding protein [Rhodospirillales bacterium]
MASLADIEDFLAQKRIALVGVARNPKDFNRVLFRSFRERGYDAVPVNPNAQELDGVRCFASVQEIQPPVDAVLVMTPAAKTDFIAKDCADAGVKRIWMYRAVGTGALSQPAVEFCRKKGMRVVDGHCPFMFLRDTPWPHRLHGFLVKIAGRYPK